MPQRPLYDQCSSLQRLRFCQPHLQQAALQGMARAPVLAWRLCKRAAAGLAGRWPAATGAAPVRYPAQCSPARAQTPGGVDGLDTAPASAHTCSPQCTNSEPTDERQLRPTCRG